LHQTRECAIADRVIAVLDRGGGLRFMDHAVAGVIRPGPCALVIRGSFD
jgi:hypothetical protein